MGLRSGLQTGLNCDPENIFLISCGLGEITSFRVDFIYAFVFWKKVYIQGSWDTYFGRSN